MEKYKSSFVLTIILLTLLLTGCNHNQTEQKDNGSNNNSSKENDHIEDFDNISEMNEQNKKEEPDIIIDFTCSILGEEVATKIGNEIKEIITSAQEGVYKLENFTIAFSNQTKKGHDFLIDITVESDWKTIRKPEDSPTIIGMNRVVKELKSKEEIEVAKSMISGYIVELSPYNEIQRIPEYFKVRFIDGQSDKYELLYPEVMGKTTLHPLKEYYHNHFKEKWEESIEMGRETLLRDLEAFRKGKR